MIGSELETLMFKHHINIQFPCGHKFMPDDYGGYCGPKSQGGDCQFWFKDNDPKVLIITEYCDKMRMGLEEMLKDLEKC